MSSIIDKLFANTTKLIALGVLLLVAWIFTVLFEHSLESLKAFGFTFLTETKWAPNV